MQKGDGGTRAPDDLDPDVGSTPFIYLREVMHVGGCRTSAEHLFVLPPVAEWEWVSSPSKLKLECPNNYNLPINTSRVKNLRFCVLFSEVLSPIIGC